MPVDTELDQGWSVRLSREIEEIAKRVADKEQRSVKTVVERAIKQYAARSK